MSTDLLSRSLVLLAPASNPHRPLGSGFLVWGPASPFLVTASHVASRWPLVAIANPQEGPAHSMLLPHPFAHHPGSDVAAAIVPAWPHLEVAPLPPLPHPRPFTPQPLWAPLADCHADYSKQRLSPAPAAGSLRACGLDHLGGPIYLARLASFPGASGSPVFSLASGRLLGLIMGQASSFDGAAALATASAVQTAISLAAHPS